MTLQERVWQRRNRLRNRFSSLAASEPRESPAPDVAPRRKATLADVAERAGVSTSTASRALNGHGGLAPATRAAVQDAAAKLNFQPSALARSLRTQQTFTVGFVVPDVSSPFYAAALKGAQGRLEQAGYRVMLMDASLDVDRELAALETLLSHQVDGLLVASTGMPRALFDGAVDAAATPTIFFDGVVDWEIADGRRAGMELLADAEPATAVLASSAELALGFMSAAATRGIRVPDDVALVAFDDPYFGDLLEPPLTAVAYDAREIGATAAELLVEAMRSETMAVEVTVPVTLVRRRSCGCQPEASR